MNIILKYDDNDHEYSVDFLKLAKYLSLTEDQVKQAVQKVINLS